MTPETRYQKTPLNVRLLCLVMATLTACSTAPAKNTWRDDRLKTTGTAKAPQMLESWGARSESEDPNDPTIAPGFLISLHCLTDSKLNGEYRVDFNGDLQLPYDITAHTTGLTLLQLRKKLVDLYRPYFKTSSEIDVRIKERRYWIDVRGLVDKPGRYLMEPESSLDSAIGMAGGTSKETPPLYVRIQKGQQMFIFDLTQYYTQGEDHPQILGWLGGEILFFQRERTGFSGERLPYAAGRTPVYMMGEVRKPGEYSLTPGADFLDSLKQAGGFTEKADLDDIEIIRTTAGHKRVYDFSWSDFQRAPAPAQGDIVFVHADNVTKFERHTSLFATLIAAAASIVTSVVLVLAYNRGRI